MDFRRIIASTIVRRLTLIALAAVLAWLGLGEARAQEPANPCPTAAAGCTQPVAFAACKAWTDWRRANTTRPLIENDCGLTSNYFTGRSCTHVPGQPTQCSAGTIANRLYYFSSGCPVGQVWFGGTFNRCDTACNARPTQTTLFYPKPGSVICERGCVRSFLANGDGETMTTQSTGQTCQAQDSSTCAALPPERGNFVWNPYLKVCEPVVPECPAGQKPVNGRCELNDFCPAGQVLNEQSVCVPREGECPAGTTRDLQGMCVSKDDDGDPNKCPTGQVKGADGTCKPDTDDDGQADDDGEEGRFGGGDNCKVPPTCSGDAIMCGQARIQWRIDCNTRRNQKISGGGCAPNTMPVCVGESCDLMQYAQLMQAWHTRCAVEKLASGSGNGGDGDGDGNRDADFDAYAAGAGDAAALSDDGVTAAGAFTDESANNGGAGGVPGGTGELDSSGLGLSRSCPNLPSVTVMGATLDFNQASAPLCDWMRLGGQFVLIIAALLSVRILASGSSV